MTREYEAPVEVKNNMRISSQKLFFSGASYNYLKDWYL